MNIGYFGNKFKKEILSVFLEAHYVYLRDFDDLSDLDFVFIFDENVDVSNLKNLNQTIMLVSFTKGESVFDKVQYIIKNKLNLGFFIEGDIITVIDPLANIWYMGDDSFEAIRKTKERLLYLKSITRKQTFSIDKNLPLNWYFNSFKLDEIKSDLDSSYSVDNLYLETIHSYSRVIYPYMGVDLEKDKNPKIRCAKTMPSFRKNNNIYVSKREIPNTFIENKDFVQVKLLDNKIFYGGDFKPSVDSPVHIKIYENYPQINYIIHTHVYIDGAPFTKVSNPCGAIEEFDEIDKIIKEVYKDTSLNKYLINLKGHGAIALGNSLEDIQNINYIRKPILEIM